MGKTPLRIKLEDLPDDLEFLPDDTEIVLNDHNGIMDDDYWDDSDTVGR